MPNYQKMYHSLFNDVTDAITKLQQAQQKTEEMYMDSKETVLTSLPGTSGEKKETNEIPGINPLPPTKKPPSHER